jgi:hypothetical protein
MTRGVIPRSREATKDLTPDIKWMRSLDFACASLGMTFANYSLKFKNIRFSLVYHGYFKKIAECIKW